MVPKVFEPLKFYCNYCHMLKFGTHKTISFLFGQNCLNLGTPKTINFPFGTNGKLMILGVPVLLKHFRVFDHNFSPESLQTFYFNTTV